MLLALLPLAAADPLFVAGARVAAGVAPDGSLCDAELALCLLWDPPGEAPMGEDLLWPGYAYEIWSATWTGPGGATTIENGAPYTGSDLTFAWASASGPDVDVLVGTASGDDADWEVRAEVPWDGDVVWLTLTVTARAALSDVRIGRVVDADSDWGWDYTYETANAVGDGWGASAGTWDGRTLAIASPDAEARICHLCTDVDGILDGSTTPATADDQLGLVSTVGDLAAGESATVRFAYGFAMDVTDAVDLAVAAAANADHDGDGADAPADCDDADATIHPDAVETTDGRDEDCDGLVDEDSAGVDDDGDGYTELDGDCNDTDAAVFPGADPVEGVADADCDGVREGRDDLPADTDGGEDTGTIEVTGGCACAGAGAPPPLAVPLLGLALATFARRRRPE